MGTRMLRLAIHAREGGRCFYCLGRMSPAVRCLDHVVPRVRRGGNGYRNLVSACSECNLQKGERRAEDLSALAVPRGAFEHRRTQRAIQRAVKTSGGEAAAVFGK